MGGQSERAKRIKELREAFKKNPRGLTANEINARFIDWGVTQDKMSEYLHFLIDIGLAARNKVYDPVEPGGKAYPEERALSWSYHWIYKSAELDGDSTAQG